MPIEFRPCFGARDTDSATKNSRIRTMCSFGKISRYVHKTLVSTTNWALGRNYVEVDGYKYTIKKQIGRGGFSSVHLVKEIESGKSFALKRVTCVDELEKQVRSQFEPFKLRWKRRLTKLSREPEKKLKL